MWYTGKLIKKNKNYKHPQNTLQWDMFLDLGGHMQIIKIQIGRYKKSHIIHSALAGKGRPLNCVRISICGIQGS